MLLSTLTPTSGRIEYFGKPLDLAREEILGAGGIRQRILAAPPRLTVAENLDIFGRLSGLSRDERQARARNFSRGSASGNCADGSCRALGRRDDPRDAGQGLSGSAERGAPGRADGVARPRHRP